MGGGEWPRLQLERLLWRAFVDFSCVVTFPQNKYNMLILKYKKEETQAQENKTKQPL